MALDKASAYAKRIWDAAQKGIAKASSGSMTHLARWTADGHITQWPVTELTLLDAVGRRQPANQYAVALPVMKARYELSGIDLPDDIGQSDGEHPEADAIGEQQSADAVTPEASETKQDDLATGDIEMTTEEINAAVAAALKAERDADEAKRKEEVAVQARIDAAVKQAKDEAAVALKQATDEAAANRRPAGWETGDAPNQAEFKNLYKYDGLDADDMGVLFGVVEAAKMAGRSKGPSEDLRRAMAIRLAEKTGADALLNC